MNNGNIVTFKKAKPAHKVKLYFPKDTTAVIGHTRFTTQGSEKNNYNNHPFEGSTDTHTFALAHNGVLYNDKELRREKNLPDTAIETDTYIAVQLLENENVVDSNSIKTMAEAVTGSFVFTILRDDNTLFLVKGDNPITLLHYPELGLYMNYTVIVLTAVLLTEMGIKVDVEGVSDICVKLHENLSANAEPGKNLVIRIFNYICCEYRNLKGIKWTTDKEGMPLKVEIIETTFEKIVTKCGFSDIASAVKFLLNDGYIVRPETGRRKAKISIDGVSAYGYRFDLNKVEEAFDVINDAVYSNVKKYKSADPFSDDTLDIINDEEAIIHAGNYRVENHKEAVSGRAFVL